MTTVTPKPPIFRSKTLQKYMHNREKAVLPRIIAPPVFIFCWIVLILLLAAGIITWCGQVPSYVTGSGIILNADTTTQPGGGATAIILLPASDFSSIHPGLPVQIQVGQTGPQLYRTINSVSQSLLSPGVVHQEYGFAVTDPSLAITVQLGSTVSQYLYAGSPVQAQVQIGSYSLLALFPGVNSLLRGQ